MRSNNTQCLKSGDPSAERVSSKCIARYLVKRVSICGGDVGTAVAFTSPIHTRAFERNQFFLFRANNRPAKPGSFSLRWQSTRHNKSHLHTYDPHARLILVLANPTLAMPDCCRACAVTPDTCHCLPESCSYNRAKMASAPWPRGRWQTTGAAATLS